MNEQKLQNIGKPVFSTREASTYLGISREYAQTLMKRLVKAKKIGRIEKGKYCLPETNAYAVAANLVFPSYVSFLSALSFYQLTTQMSYMITVACAVNKKEIELEGNGIEFVHLSSKRLFGYTKVDTGTGFALIADPEKAIIDSLCYPKEGSISEASQAIPNVNTEKLVDYAIRMKSKIVLKRLGYLLEKNGVEIKKKLVFSKKYEPLDTSFPSIGKKDRKWKLIINREIE